jgi:hypothetical protein
MLDNRARISNGADDLESRVLRDIERERTNLGIDRHGHRAENLIVHLVDVGLARQLSAEDIRDAVCALDYGLSPLAFHRPGARLKEDEQTPVIGRLQVHAGPTS